MVGDAELLKVNGFDNFYVYFKACKRISETKPELQYSELWV